MKPLTPEQSALVAEHWGLARGLARKHAAKHPSLNLDFESAAAEALCDVASRFTNEHAAKFWTFASYRVKGAFLDEMRKERLLGYPRGKYEGTPEVYSMNLADHDATHSEVPIGWEMQWQDNVESLAGRLEWLPREVVILSYLYGFTLEKIGRVLNISETWASKIRIEAISLMRRSVNPETYHEWRVAS